MTAVPVGEDMADDGAAIDPRDYGAAPDYAGEGDGAKYVPPGRRLARSLSPRSRSA
jgi:hypothetical protein